MVLPFDAKDGACAGVFESGRQTLSRASLGLIPILLLSSLLKNVLRGWGWGGEGGSKLIELAKRITCVAVASVLPIPIYPAVTQRGAYLKVTVVVV